MKFMPMLGRIRTKFNTMLISTTCWLIQLVFNFTNPLPFKLCSRPPAARPPARPPPPARRPPAGRIRGNRRAKSATERAPYVMQYSFRAENRQFCRAQRPPPTTKPTFPSRLCGKRGPSETPQIDDIRAGSYVAQPKIDPSGQGQ